MTTYGDALYQYGGVPVGAFQPDGSGVTYFVDNNKGNDGNTGLSWEKAFSTLSRATTISNVQTASGGVAARRNTIYLSADRLVEDLTTLPDKCDIVGVGSTDSFKGGTLEGDHAVTSGTGTRFFNMGFEPGTSADIFTFTTCSGIEFWNSQFRANRGGATAVSGIDSTACINLKVIGCEFRGAFSADYIDIGAGAIDGTIIKDNIMVGGADNGFMVTGTATITGGNRGIIVGNFIECADIFIDVNATSLFNVMDNVCISGETLGSSSYVIDLTFASGNRVTGNDVSATIPVIPAT